MKGNMTPSCWPPPGRSAWAGASRIAEILSADAMCPAVGQGALAIETRGSGAGFDAARALDHAPPLMPRSPPNAAFWRRSVEAARCPSAPTRRFHSGGIRLLGVVASPDGSELVRAESEGAVEEAAALGQRLGEELLGLGAKRILEAVYQ